MREPLSVEVLWTRLQEMEAQRSFDGHPYPVGMSPFPFRLTGQGFFPGGDGLWREDSGREQPSNGLLPACGIVFVGNDFGTLQSYERLRKKGYENPPTWRHIKQRVRDAHLPQELTFFTNAVLGLRIEGKALDEKGWGKRPDFAKFCRTFLVYQIEMLRPKLVVVLGQQSRPIVESLTVEESIYDGQVTPRRTKIGNHTTAICCTTHPFGDNFKPDRKAQEAVLLRAAWTFAEELRY